MVSPKIIQGCRKNDRQCQKQLYQQCAPYVYSIVKSYIKDQGFIKDVMQESFTSIFTSIHKYDDTLGTFKSWISRISTYRSVDFLKLNNKIKINTELEVVDHLTEDNFAHLDSLTKSDIEHLLSEMPSGYRTIFMLAAIDDYSHVEIGKMLEITPETSRSQLHRGLKWIKKNLNLTPNQIRI
jgi:RNA polymerase sigma-70 factor (ECF subfamily)